MIWITGDSAFFTRSDEGYFGWRIKNDLSSADPA
jgi:hypothetical protein